MPPRQVYGKRSRAIYGSPLDDFWSPPRTTKVEDVAVLTCEKHDTTEKAVDGKTKTEKGKRRSGKKRVMAERAVNEVLLSGGQGPVSARKRRPRKIIEDEEEDDRGLKEEETSQEPASRKSPPPTSSQNPDSTAELEETCKETTATALLDKPGEASRENPTPKPVDSHQSNETENETDSIHQSSELGAIEPTAPQSPSTPSIALQPATNPLEDHLVPLLSLSSHPLQSFSEWSSQLTTHFCVAKMAEASYGEVYHLSLQEDVHIPGFSKADESVLKLIALKPPPTTTTSQDGHQQDTMYMSFPADVATEVRLLQRMSSIPGYTNFREVRVVQGRASEAFAQAWQDFNERLKAGEKKKQGSEYPDPGSGYSEEQLWAVVEMQDAGSDLERCIEDGACSSVWAVWDLFWQTALALAKGEEGAEFEHRDLHLGNICIRWPDREKRKTGQQKVDFSRKFNFTGAETTLIDYTFARARMSTTSSNPSFIRRVDSKTSLRSWASDNSTASSPSSSHSRSDSPSDEVEQDPPIPYKNPSTDPAIAYNNLSADPEIFQGDGKGKYQYEIYRYMRGLAVLGDAYGAFLEDGQPKCRTNMPADEVWATFHPTTNLAWLHYVLYSLLEQVSWPSKGRKTKGGNRGGKKARARAAEDRARHEKACELERALLQVQELLDPKVLGDSEDVLEEGDGEPGLQSARELVGVALAEGWLDVGDVVGEENEDDSTEMVERLKSMRLSYRKVHRSKDNNDDGTELVELVERTNLEEGENGREQAQEW